MDMKKSAKTREMIAELHEDVERGAGGILEGIAHGIAHDGSLRHSSPCAGEPRRISDPNSSRMISPVTSSRLGMSMYRPPFSTYFLALSHAPPVLTRWPAGRPRPCAKTDDGLDAKEHPGENGRGHDQDGGRDHLAEGRVGGDLDAPGVVGARGRGYPEETRSNWRFTS